MHARQPALRLAVVLLLLASGAAAAGTMETPAPGGAVERIPVWITRPTGDGPFPAVVAGVCTDARPGRTSVSPSRRAHDAHAALAHGRSLAYHPVAPLLVLIGALDDWTPAEPCRQMVEAARAAGHPVRYIGTRIAEAWADSIREVLAFFDQHLAPAAGSR